jgi:hypothetical protein
MAYGIKTKRELTAVALCVIHANQAVEQNAHNAWIMDGAQSVMKDLRLLEAYASQHAIPVTMALSSVTIPLVGARSRAILGLTRWMACVKKM